MFKTHLSDYQVHFYIQHKVLEIGSTSVFRLTKYENMSNLLGLHIYDFSGKA